MLVSADDPGEDWLAPRLRREAMLALGTGGIVVLAIVLVILIVLFFVVLGRARRG